MAKSTGSASDVGGRIPSTGDPLRVAAPGEAESPEEMFKRFLSERGLKYTAERREILLAVLEMHDHFEAEDLLFALRKKNNRISKATIYRSISILLESGILRETRLSDKRNFYELEYGHGGHDHMIDERTGQVVEFRSKELQEIIKAICNNYGFQMKRHRLQIYGTFSDEDEAGAPGA